MRTQKYPIEEYGALFDAHVHSCYDLHDGLLTPKQLVRLTEKNDLNWVLAMNHDTTLGFDRIMKEAKERGLPCLTGIEISTFYNHILGYGVQEWPYRRDVWDPSTIIDALRDQDCAVFLSHPCNNPGHGYWTPEIAKKLDIDGIEWNNASNTILNRRTRKMFKDYPKGRRIAGTDAHTPYTFGYAYTQVFENSEDADDLIRAMQRGKCFPRGQYVPLISMIREQFVLAVKNKIIGKIKVNGKWIETIGDMPGSIAPDGFPAPNILKNNEIKKKTKFLAKNWVESLNI